MVAKAIAMGVSGGFKGVPRADDLVRLLRGDRWVCFDWGLVGITDFGYGVAWLSLVVRLGDLGSLLSSFRFGWGICGVSDGLRGFFFCALFSTLFGWLDWLCSVGMELLFLWFISAILSVGSPIFSSVCVLSSLIFVFDFFLVSFLPFFWSPPFFCRRNWAGNKLRVGQPIFGIFCKER